jgi:iron complex transport system substrate-binding protein
VVSTNPCLDVILVRVADRSQVTALSRYARDPQGSTIADIAARLPVTGGAAEEIAALRPDLVLLSTYAPASTRTALTRMGLSTAAFGLPSTVEERRAARPSPHPPPRPGSDRPYARPRGATARADRRLGHRSEAR